MCVLVVAAVVAAVAAAAAGGSSAFALFVVAPVVGRVEAGGVLVVAVGIVAFAVGGTFVVASVAATSVVAFGGSSSWGECPFPACACRARVPLHRGSWGVPSSIGRETSGRETSFHS